MSLSLLNLLCCCWPLALIALIYSKKVNRSANVHLSATYGTWSLAIGTASDYFLKVHTGFDDYRLLYKCCAVCPRHKEYIKAEGDYMYREQQLANTKFAQWRSQGWAKVGLSCLIGHE